MNSETNPALSIDFVFHWRRAWAALRDKDYAFYRHHLKVLEEMYRRVYRVNPLPPEWQVRGLSDRALQLKEGGDSWAAVFGNLEATLMLEAAYCEYSGSPQCFSRGRSAKGAELMAWRLLSKGVPYDL